MANGLKNRNFIACIEQEGGTVVDLREIGKVFADNFKQLFGAKRPSRFRVDLQKLFVNKLLVDLSFLERLFTVEEIKSAVFDLGEDKALGPDGFPIQFFKQFWETIKSDLLLLCDDFFWLRANLGKINLASITLIPKVETPAHPGDYRPVSLINSSLKIISKILATRLVWS